MKKTFRSLDEILADTKARRERLEKLSPGCTAAADEAVKRYGESTTSNGGLDGKPFYSVTDEMLLEDEQLKAIEAGLESKKSVQQRGADVLARYLPGARLDVATARQAMKAGTLTAKQAHARFEVQRLESELPTAKGTTKRALEAKIKVLRDVADAPPAASV